MICREYSSFPGSSDGKASAYNTGDLGLIPGWGRSPGEGNDNPLQYSGLKNPMDRGAWWATVHGAAKSQARLSDFTSYSIWKKGNYRDGNAISSGKGAEVGEVPRSVTELFRVIEI